MELHSIIINIFLYV